ncbi:type IV pilus modification protein PilV [Shewanella sp. D64]|uniref:type IV pilus modification protein PilV n=1 Tax=unclassified Shewanella TaxID=196818 RepID=UPI0022BA62EA|nr:MULTISPECIES: type IV pilus modification protein PilV [unclassified Shewanella]MEC4727806.1 type IV pilus modification protein PilV [Shewanella sp. D64]MEC4739343.1 type IV pilus modification protein PilV [Shewanella sp. E94]WBJ97000.1 type IV pilus modification protein PilV [Shewanella sp. MTB7]
MTQVKNEIEGFSLIEVLVSLVILVIGLIGIFNLHIVSKRSSFESFQQTQASYYVNDIINRMKLNRTQLNNYNGTFSGALSLPGTSCDVAVNAAAVICTNVETRLWDLYQWEQLFGGASEKLSGRDVGGLDTPTACIQAQANGQVLVVMTWRGIRRLSDGAENATGDNASFTKGCGTSGDRRRVYSIDTVII